jgi:hypothetical protein
MQSSDLEKLRRMWSSQPCEHSDYVHEMDEGQRTGYQYCSVCGRMLTQEMREELEAGRAGCE